MYRSSKNIVRHAVMMIPAPSNPETIALCHAIRRAAWLESYDSIYSNELMLHYFDHPDKDVTERRTWSSHPSLQPQPQQQAQQIRQEIFLAQQLPHDCDDSSSSSSTSDDSAYNNTTTAATAMTSTTTTTGYYKWTYNPVSGIAELNSLYVHPKYHGQGIGTNLWNHLMKM